MGHSSKNTYEHTVYVQYTYRDIHVASDFGRKQSIHDLLHRSHLSGTPMVFRRGKEVCGTIYHAQFYHFSDIKPH